jgi:lysozyme
MQISPTGAAFIRSYEQLRLTAYLDTVAQPNVWTIGYGQTGPDIVEGLVWTPEQAEARFQAALRIREAELNAELPHGVSQYEFDALLSLGYNAGFGPKGLGGSTLLRLFNAGDLAGAAREFTKWCHAGGAISPGLLARRTAELVMFAGLS